MTQGSTPYSALKLFMHSGKLVDIKKGDRSAPIYVRIKPTNACNQKCNYCRYTSGQYFGLNIEKNKPDQIPWPIMQGIINDFAQIGVKAVTFSGGGDPLVYPHIIPAMEGFLKKNIHISVITNGQALNGKIAETVSEAKWVRISFDAACAATYEKIRGAGAKFDQVCENIKRFSQNKSQDCEVGINFVVNQQNCREVYDAGKLLYGLGVDHIKYATCINDNFIEYHKDIKDEVNKQIEQVTKEFSSSKFRIINKYGEEFDATNAFHRNYSRCVINEVVTVIAADCKMYYCHEKAYLDNGYIGDLSKASFQEIWFAERTVENAKRFDPQKECRHHCVYDDRNILLNQFLNMDEKHINFI